jgi:Zn-dependent protease
MGRSLTIGYIAGIRLKVHWTFFLLLAWILLSSLTAGSADPTALLRVGFVVTLFGCVVLHELGHALAARWFGIPTRDITLLPIGGVARLERMPRKPVQELIVALAGPAVNVIIAGLLFAFLAFREGIAGLAAVPLGTGAFLQQLMTVNVILVLFNLLPAFPMDGGRVLRALLAMFLDYTRATQVASRLGQVCAVGLGLLGLANPILLLVAVFVFFAASTEARQVEAREQLAGRLVRDGMIRGYLAVPANASVRDVAPHVFETSQSAYPFVMGDALVGMLPRDEVLAALERVVRSTVADIMERDVHTVEESDALIDALERAPSTSGSTLPVTRAGNLTGVLELRNVFEIVRARATLHTAPA